MSNSSVNAELINPFVTASFSVLSMILGEAPKRGTLSAQPDCFTSQQVNVAVGVTGDLSGSIILGMSLATADKIASTMIGQPVKVFDQMAASAMAELANMICGNALLNISEAGFVCDLTPPTVIRGAQVQISTLAIPLIVVPLQLSHGDIYMNIGFQMQSQPLAQNVA